MTFKIGDEVRYVYNPHGLVSSQRIMDGSIGIVKDFNHTDMTLVRWKTGIRSGEYVLHYNSNLRLTTPVEIPYDPSQMPDEEDDV